MKVVDTYRIIIKVKDQSKNEIEFPVLVEVKDLIPPKLEFNDDLYIYNFMKPNYENHIKTTDNYDKTVQIIIEDEKINYESIGTHQIKNYRY